MDKDLKRINCQLSLKKLAPILRAVLEMCKEDPKKCGPYEYVVIWPPRGHDDDGAQWTDKNV